MTTLGEVPSGVEPPYLISKTSTTLELEWNGPKYSSGNITGYILRQVLSESSNDENIIYFGLVRYFKVTNLKPLTNYTYSVEACNTIGCTRSSRVSFTTSEIAPLKVATPILLNITARSATIRFSKPPNDQILNAHLIGYIIFIIPNIQSASVVLKMNLTMAINVSNCEECGVNVKILDNLIPGTNYTLVLSACTNGGCTNSSKVAFKTLDALPDVYDIVIRALVQGDDYLVLTWNAPMFPNGILTYYILFKDELQIYQGLDRNFTVTDLLPFTSYLFYLKVIERKLCKNFVKLCQNKKT